MSYPNRIVLQVNLTTIYWLSSLQDNYLLSRETLDKIIHLMEKVTPTN